VEGEVAEEVVEGEEAGVEVAVAVARSISHFKLAPTAFRKASAP